MQRALIVIVMLALVAVAISAGALAAHWPFWQRAWQWHAAADGWPQNLPGPTRVLQPAATPASLTVTVDPALATLAQGTGTALLMVADATGHTRAFFSADVDERTPIDGRQLSNGLLVVLYGALIQQGRARLLDEPLGNLLALWKHDPRGAITPRQLLWQLSGLSGGPSSPLNPFSPLAQLASGPDFERAVLKTPLRYPPGSHYQASPANAQLLGLVAGRLAGDSYGSALQRLVWSRLAAQPAIAMLDHRRGDIAAHCCFTASAGDWLRLGLLLASGHRNRGQQVLPPDFLVQVEAVSPVNPGQGLGFALGSQQGRQLLQMATTGRRMILAPDSGAALFWAGTGEPPAGLAALLLQGQ
ncbi:MAG: serine hydrolase domain-containing protein [Pseudomonadota bacterium]